MSEESETILPKVQISAVALNTNRRYKKEKNLEGTLEGRISVNNKELEVVDLEQQASADEFTIKGQCEELASEVIKESELGGLEDKISIGNQNDDYRYEYVQGESGRYNKECKQCGNMYWPVRENLDKYIVSAGKANIVILTRILAIIFTEYNRGSV
ncbi:hypothetical protein PVAP13_6NG170606 [Panicum virgatum]|uniref:Uncharacterized protein n=1 Tax=Panicum virgatum TaxID=38727 RepID=A0A8T0QXI2_PANVG|nr:hypothetical protein PVAP13_6NG170606 [Panicum virgatum]